MTSIFKTASNVIAPIPDMRSRPRDAMRPSRAFISRPMEGVGNAGCPLHPRPRVHFVLVERTRVTTSTPESPGIPARNGFNSVCRALPGDRAVLPPSPADMFCLSPVGPTQLRELDTSVGVSGPHDFAVRSNISRPRAVDRSQAHHPPCNPIARKTLPRPPHPVPYVRDDRETPLCVGRDAKSSRGDLGGVKREIFFGKSEIRLDSPVKKPPDGQIT
jgi:hypothetical protein